MESGGIYRQGGSAKILTLARFVLRDAGGLPPLGLWAFWGLAWGEDIGAAAAGAFCTTRALSATTLQQTISQRCVPLLALNKFN